MVCFQVDVVHLRLFGHVAAVFTNIDLKVNGIFCYTPPSNLGIKASGLYLRSPLLVLILVGLTVNFETMRL